MSDIAVLAVDMLNAYRHRDAELLATNVAAIVDPLADLVSRAKSDDQVGLIYINDNYRDFAAGRAEVASSALNGERPDLVESIVPDDGFRLLIRVRHCAFYSTPLGYLLGQLGTSAVGHHRTGH
jgi:nicotinamidase-related amidase